MYPIWTDQALCVCVFLWVRILSYKLLLHCKEEMSILERYSCNQGLAGKADYVVFATDYENYGAVYSCQSILFGHRRSASILSRRPTLDQPFINKVSYIPDNLLRKGCVSCMTCSSGLINLLHDRFAQNWKPLELILTTSPLSIIPIARLSPPQACWTSKSIQILSVPEMSSMSPRMSEKPLVSCDYLSNI